MTDRTEQAPSGGRVLRSRHARGALPPGPAAGPIVHPWFMVDSSGRRTLRVPSRAGKPRRATSRRSLLVGGRAPAVRLQSHTCTSAPATFWHVRLRRAPALSLPSEPHRFGKPLACASKLRVLSLHGSRPLNFELAGRQPRSTARGAELALDLPHAAPAVLRRALSFVCLSNRSSSFPPATPAVLARRSDTSGPWVFSTSSDASFTFGASGRAGG